MAKQNVEYESGKSQDMSYVHREAMTGGTVYFTVKDVENDLDDTDSSALISKEITSFTDSDTTASWLLSDADMNLAEGKYYYDIVFEDSSSRSEPAAFHGTFKVSKRVTNRNTAV